MSLKEKYSFILYLPSLIFGIIAAFSFEYQLLNYFLLLIIAFGIIPILELILKPSKLTTAQSSHFFYDLILYIIVFLQYGLLIWFLLLVKTQELTIWQSIGLISTMGILCGVYGINTAHELGHRVSKLDRFFAKSLLLTSLYMHFFIEHNRGHHKRVGTPEDPATARKNESLYRFWMRCIKQSYLSAYRLEKDRLQRQAKPVLSFSNAWLQFQIIQLLFILIIALLFGLKALLFFIISALIGILLLETINYVEHYGLVRSKNKLGVYDRVEPIHSWNSDHILGRYLLFELTRHSDHHDNSTKKYPKLTSRKNAPQLPFGYPMMMLLAMLPFIWRSVMNKRL